jgi:hypothetical protein
MLESWHIEALEQYILVLQRKSRKSAAIPFGT